MWIGSWWTDEEPMEAVGAVDAQNAPTAPWKTTEQFSTSFHRHPRSLREGDISIELRTGTFLSSFDTDHKIGLDILAVPRYT